MGCTSIDQYRIVVGRVGMVFDGNGKSEANHQLTLFVMQSKDVKWQSVEEPVMLFKIAKSQGSITRLRFAQKFPKIKHKHGRARLSLSP